MVMESDDILVEKRDLMMSANSAALKVWMTDILSEIVAVVLLVVESAVATAAVTAFD